jgi:hypothetical protein
MMASLCIICFAINKGSSEYFNWFTHAVELLAVLFAGCERCDSEGFDCNSFTTPIRAPEITVSTTSNGALALSWPIWKALKK